MVDMGEPKIGSLYSLIDPAETMAADPKKRMIHTKCMIFGDDECQFETIRQMRRSVETWWLAGTGAMWIP